MPRNSTESPVERHRPPKECQTEVEHEQMHPVGRYGVKSGCRARGASIFGVLTDGGGTGELSLLLIGRLIGKAHRRPCQRPWGPVDSKHINIPE